MKKLLFMMAFAAIIFTSCEEEDEYTLTHKFSGELNVKLEDASGEPISGITLTLKDDGEELDEQVTDEKGNVTFGTVNSGNYTIYGQDIKDGDYNYDVFKSVQVVAAQEKETTIVPSQYNTTINIDVTEYYQYQSETTPLGSDVKVALLSLPDHHMYQYGYNELPFEELKKFILAEQQADGTKKEFVFENIPLHNYLLMFYTDKNFFVVATSINAYNKGETMYLKHSIQSVTIREYRADQKFNVQHRVYDETSGYYTYEAYNKCKIYILDYSNFYNLNNRTDEATIKNLAIDQGISGTDGFATINVLKHRELIAICFNPDGIYIDYNSFSIDFYDNDYTMQFTYYSYN